MPACPNCGRATMRTKDWACQWCGYPLLSRAYKLIDKTFRELKEEREAALRKPPAVSETPAPPPPKSAVINPPPAKVETPAPVPVIEPAPLSKTVMPPVEKAAPPPPPEPEPEAVLPQETATPQVAMPAPGLAPPAEEAVAGREGEEVPPPAVEISPPAPESPPVTPPSLESLGEGVLVSVEELDALYKADRAGAHARLLNKVIRVRGTVEKVFIRDHIDVRYIMLAGSGKRRVLWSVRANFNKESISQMSRLSEGQEVTVRGKYDGYGKNIILKDCVLV
ncbi:MAG: hypothetical protein N2506_01080 [Dehalococcoidales bacterium]|nr:hypothetical protein [Dehalococcoidales bacterium]